MNQEAIQERKAQLVQRQLLGLKVTYSNHSGGGLTPNMAKVNGWSIIWHEYSFGCDELDQVEVMMKNGECERVFISELRELVG